jgi:hypothetical protein
VGNVIFGSGVITSSGTSTLARGQAATITCTTYSGGTLVYAWTGASALSSGPPEQISGLVANAESASTVILAWTAASTSPTSYSVQYRVSGTTGWSTAPSVTTPGCTVTSLLSATNYDFVVSASNSAGAGSPSAIVTATTLASLSPPGQAADLTTSNATTSSISLAWSPPASGGAASSYTVQYRASGTSSWSTGVSGLAASTFIVSELLPTTSYDFDIIAVNAAGTGPASGIATASTASGDSVTSIAWNVTPSGNYAHGTGAIGVNALVSPSSASVQFGFSTSPTVPPTTWTVASFVNTSLWGAYVNTPIVSGIWYCWAEGTDGSSPTAWPTGFLVT